MNRSFLGLCLVLLIAGWLRLPFVYAGLPYLSDEDEAHHHNRVINMVKQGDFNPRYFHKPSLHFYLRMPVISAAFLWSVRAQEIQKVSEIVSSDPFGLGGYSFSAYPQRILIWDRGLSVALSLIAIILLYFIALELGASSICALICAAVAAVSPALTQASATVGVDVVMTCACLATSLLALRTLKNFSLKRLCLTALVAGLAVSSKYNALPIVAVPIFIAIFHTKQRTSSTLVAIGTAALGFFLASPYILVSLPLFLDQFAYEIWHYGVAGHVGHQAEPGLAQAHFYLSWLVHEGVGWVGLLVAAAMLMRLGKITKKTIAILVFPVLYFILMISQRANFTRNMLVMIPYCALAIGFGVEMITQRVLVTMRSTRHSLVSSFGTAVIILPLVWHTVSLRVQANNAPETRIEAAKWLEAQVGDSAIAGQLQFAAETVTKPQIERIDLAKTSIEQLYQSGYTRVVSPKHALSEAQLVNAQLEKSFKGEEWPQRVVVNPSIDVFNFNFSPSALLKLVAAPEVTLDRDQKMTCSNNDLKAEGHCWLNHRVTSIELQYNPAQGLKLALMSPWPKQTISRLEPDGRVVTLIENDQLNPGEWREVDLAPASASTRRIVLLLSEIHVPASYKIGEDRRRLGVAVKSPTGANR